MLGFIAATLGGLVKDIQVGLEHTYEYVVEEVSSIPEAFSTGYDHGIVTSPEPIQEDVELKEAELHMVETANETHIKRYIKRSK